MLSEKEIDMKNAHNILLGEEVGYKTVHRL